MQTGAQTDAYVTRFGPVARILSDTGEGRLVECHERGRMLPYILANNEGE